MFERRSVVNRLGVITVKYLGHQRAIQNIAENGGIRGLAGCRELHVDFVEILFGMIEKNQGSRPARSERLCKSGPDAASCPCNEGAPASVRYVAQRCVHV